jgi:hypothetical protein
MVKAVEATRDGLAMLAASRVPRELAKGRESEEIECERSRPFLTTF